MEIWQKKTKQNEKTEKLKIVISCELVCVSKLVPNDCINFDKTFCVRSRGFENGLDSKFCSQKRFPVF